MRFATAALLVLIAAAPATTRPVEIRRGLPHGGPTTSPDDRARMGFARLIERIEPSGRGSSDRLGFYLAEFRKEFVEDPRLFAFSVDTRVGSDGSIVLSGYVEYSEHRQSLLRFLQQLGFDRIDDRIEMLPAQSPGDRIVGFVSAERAFVYDRSSATSPRETVTECLRDEPVFLLKETDDGHFLVHCADGYVGYIAADAVRPVDVGEFAARLSRFENDRTPRTIDRVIEHASKKLGVKYVWGGRSAEGVDCSGLVQTSFKSQGINLPRDADQQAGVGRLVATRACRGGLRRGDLLFFVGRAGQVRHVALYLGDQKYIQAADEGVHVSSFDPKDPAYDEKHDRGFCFAKRVLE